ncbi:hypothetical protein I6F09_23545 [Bradyrhizobium sp. IC3195]|uniref:hypothetical protein n=1 Tax=Bradyrhizobium sp. IC3195 TaxID=2793804 RepID=UPI001CD6BAA7|nr:hypothetical protein [Bradyrhizobium sp. IC3195]MCA1470864.1 hypothetical protein [Bradyrhizobium sp. IC3195]
MPITIPDANNLPIAKHRRRHKKPINRPMTQEERDALQFEAIKAEFDWSNDEWAATWLPWVRLAAIHVAGDQDKLKELMAGFVKDGEAGNILEGLTRTRMHLETLHKLVDAALGRSFIVLERLGYSPDNLPPDGRVH